MRIIIPYGDYNGDPTRLIPPAGMHPTNVAAFMAKLREEYTGDTFYTLNVWALDECTFGEVEMEDGRKLKEHPLFDKWKDILLPGEFWTWSAGWFNESRR